MEQHDFLQGSPEWHAHRATHFNASDAPAMLGISSYKSRTQLLQELSSGIAAEIDEATQRRFDEGHRFEALARPLAEKIIGKKLYPVVGSEGKLSASFDGITMDETICFEHKTLNGNLDINNLSELYTAQMEQQLMVSGAERCVFMASKWNDDNTLIEEQHCWYGSDLVMRNRLLQGWTQFAIDLENYQHVEHTERPAPQVTIELPALFIQATGEITASNMRDYGTALAAKLVEVRAIKLITDQDFSNAKEAAKIAREQYKKLELVKAGMLEQTVTIGEAVRMIDAWREDWRVTALQLEKDVEREDLAKKRAMTTEAIAAFNVHVAALESEIEAGAIVAHGIGLTCQMPDFGAAIKGKRSYTSMQDAIHTALANGKITAAQIAADLRKKILWLRENADDYGFLLNDLQTIIYKPFDDFKLLIETRINNHQQKETQRLALERARIQAEEEAKACAKAEAETAAKLAEERARIQVEERAKIAAAAPEIRPVSTVSVLPTLTASGSEKPRPRPTRMQLIEAVAKAYGVSILTADEWLRAAFAMEVAA